MKVCIEPGCAQLQHETRCAAHRRGREQARGSRQDRGYDAEHDAERRRWAPLVATGAVKCWRCRLHIAADAPWDLGHDDADRSRHRGPEHVRCNRSTAGRISPDA
jgi:hypothetical protein